MRARNVFLDEQARQAFVPAPLRPLPELLSDVLDPVLRLGRVDAGALVDYGLPCFFGAQTPSALSLADLVGWQLRPRREQPRTEVPVEEQDLTASCNSRLRPRSFLGRAISKRTQPTPDRRLRWMRSRRTCGGCASGLKTNGRPAPHRPALRPTRSNLERTVRWIWYLTPEMKARLDELLLRLGNLSPLAKGLRTPSACLPATRREARPFPHILSMVIESPPDRDFRTVVRSNQRSDTRHER
jgi:hypothetical protein